jgi:hypothetical protein
LFPCGQTATLAKLRAKTEYVKGEVKAKEKAYLLRKGPKVFG